MTATPPPDLREFVQAELASGEYANMDQMLEAGLRSLQERREELKAALQIGIDQLERGESAPFDTMRTLLERIAARERVEEPCVK